MKVYASEGRLLIEKINYAKVAVRKSQTNPQGGIVQMEKKISAAAIDVFDQEPYEGPLRELDNVILTPHIGSYAKEVRVKMEMEAVHNLIEAMKGI